MVNLKCLSLKRASLFDSSFQGLFRLEIMVLINCNFENLKSQSFRCLTNIKRLEIEKPENLNDINLNELSKLNSLRLVEVSNIFESLKNDNVENLAFYSKNFDYFDGKSISGFSKLKSLTLASTLGYQCHIKYFNLNFFSSLESLFLENFQFSSFNILCFPELCNLKILTLMQCKTLSKINHADLFKRLSQLENLTIIDFSDFFKEIPSNVFDELKNLTELDLRDNNLIDINPKWFAHMQKLKSLDLSDNQIIRVTKVMFTYLTNLTYLSLNMNQFYRLDDGVFSDVKNLENLCLSYNNNLRELKPHVFVGLDKLKRLEMQDLNQNLKLDVDLFQTLPSLNTVFLDERFEESVLYEKYGSGIKFFFLE